VQEDRFKIMKVIMVEIFQ